MDNRTVHYFYTCGKCGRTYREYAEVCGKCGGPLSDEPYAGEKRFRGMNPLALAIWRVAAAAAVVGTGAGLSVLLHTNIFIVGGALAAAAYLSAQFSAGYLKLACYVAFFAVLNVCVVLYIVQISARNVETAELFMQALTRYWWLVLILVAEAIIGALLYARMIRVYEGTLTTFRDETVAGESGKEYPLLAGEVAGKRKRLPPAAGGDSGKGGQ